MQFTKRLAFASTIAVLFQVGCSNSTSIPESIRRKAKESHNNYGDAKVQEQRADDNKKAKAEIDRYRIQNHEDWTMRQTASYALGRIGPAAVPGLVQLLRGSPDPVMRRQAVETLSRIGPDAAKAVPDLTYALNDPDPIVRKTAARALGQIGPAAADAAPALIRFFQIPDEQ